MSLQTNIGVQLFNNRPRKQLLDADVDAYTTRYYLAALQKLDILEGKTDFTQEEWFDLIGAAVLIRTIIPGDSQFPDYLNPKSALEEHAPVIDVVVEGVTITGSIPIRYTVHDLYSDQWRCEAQVRITGSDILSGFDATKISGTLRTLKLQYDTHYVSRLIGYLDDICEKVEARHSDPEPDALRFVGSMGSANFDPEQFSRCILNEPEHYLTHTRFKVQPNTLLIPGGKWPVFAPGATLKAYEVKSGMIAWDPINTRLVEMESPPVEIERIAGNSGGVNMDIIPYNVRKTTKRYTCAGEAVYVGLTSPNGRTSGKFDPRDTDVKVYSVQTDSHVTYSVDQMLDKCWLLFDKSGAPSKYVNKAVYGGGDGDKKDPDARGQHPYFRGALDLDNGDLRAIASQMERSAPQSHTETAEVFPFTRIEAVNGGGFAISVAKYLGDATLQAIPRENFAIVARQIASALGDDIGREVATFSVLDREIFETSQSSDDATKNRISKLVSVDGTIDFDKLNGEGNFGGSPIPPGAGPYEYLTSLAANRAAFTRGGDYGKKAADLLQSLNRIYAAVSRYLGESDAFSSDKVPRYSATRTSMASFYYALSSNDWKFMGGENPIYFGIKADDRKDSTSSRSKVSRAADGTLTYAKAAGTANKLRSALAFFSLNSPAPNNRKRKRTDISSKQDGVDLGAMKKSSSSGKKKSTAKKSSSKKSKAVESETLEEHAADDAMDISGPYMNAEEAVGDGSTPIDLFLRLSTADQSGGDLIPALVWALCLVKFDYSSFKKLTSAGISLPFPFAACSKLVLKVEKTLFLKRTRQGEFDLTRGAGIQLAIFDPIANKQALATEEYDIRLKHRNVMNIATDVTGLPTHIAKKGYKSGRNRMFFESAKQYKNPQMGEGVPDTLVVPMFFGEYPGTEQSIKPFIMADPMDDGCPPVAHPNQKRYASLLLNQLSGERMPVANTHCLFNTLDEARHHQPAYYFPGSFFQTDRELKKDLFHKGTILPGARAHVPGAKQGYYGEMVLGTGIPSQVDLI